MAVPSPPLLLSAVGVCFAFALIDWCGLLFVFGREIQKDMHLLGRLPPIPLCHFFSCCCFSLTPFLTIQDTNRRDISLQLPTRHVTRVSWMEMIGTVANGSDAYASSWICGRAHELIASDDWRSHAIMLDGISSIKCKGF
jgi:hypothetical protein